MPQTYTLVMEVDDAGLRRLGEDDAWLAVGKSAGNGPPNVVWLAWAPSGSDTIAWGDAYGVFAAHVPGAGAPLNVLAAIHPAAERALYPFVGERFAAPGAGGRIPRRHYNVRNDAPFAAAFGLLQAATLNGAAVAAPVNAVVLPPGFTADFSAMTKLHVWVQRSPVPSGILARAPVAAAVIELDPGDAVQCYRYDVAAGAFVRRGKRA